MQYTLTWKVMIHNFSIFFNSKNTFFNNNLQQNAFKLQKKYLQKNILNVYQN